MTSLEVATGCARDATRCNIVHASRAFLHGMTVAMLGSHVPDARTIDDALSVFRCTEEALSEKAFAPR